MDFLTMLGNAVPACMVLTLLARWRKPADGDGAAAAYAAVDQTAVDSGAKSSWGPDYSFGSPSAARSAAAAPLNGHSAAQRPRAGGEAGSVFLKHLSPSHSPRTMEV